MQNHIRTIILSSSLAFFVVIVSLILFVKFYQPKLNLGKYYYQTKKDEIFGIDAQSIQVFSNEAKDSPYLTLFIGNPTLDKDWNSSATSYSTGRLLGEYLASWGISNIRYNPRGTDKFYNQSSHLLSNFDLLASDFYKVYKYARQKQKKIYILAHSDAGCHLALYSIQKWNLKYKALLLLACTSTGDYYNTWIQKLFFNMERQGVSKAIIQEAKIELEEWEKTGYITKGSRKTHSDLLAFRKALHTFASHKNTSFRFISKKINYFSILEKELEKGKNILHILPEYDEERSIQNLERHSLLNRKFSNYNYIYLKNSCHFFKDQNKIPKGFLLIWDRLNPFRSLNKSFLQEIKNFIKENR